MGRLEYAIEARKDEEPASTSVTGLGGWEAMRQIQQLLGGFWVRLGERRGSTRTALWQWIKLHLVTIVE